jgi:hypothetical protein
MRQLNHTLTRRRFLLTSVAASLLVGNSKVIAQTESNFLDWLAGKKTPSTALNQSSNRTKYIAEIIEEYDSQGFHRTGTVVDRVSALWLVGRIQQLGLEAVLEKFPLSRVDPVQAYIQIGERRVEGVPMFDGTFTDVSGVQGKLGFLGTEADIGLKQISPLSTDTAKDEEFQAARISGRYKAIIAITKGGQPGLTLVNAPNFTSPFGVPVLQVSSEEAGWLEEAAKQGKNAVLVAQVRRTDADALNVTTIIKGRESNLAPLIVMTPRSGWWNCAAERGGGLACWLEVMTALSVNKPARDLVFLASSGHELGGMGLKFFLAQRPNLVKTAKVWLHFGANIGAADGKGSFLYASSEELEKIAVTAMSQTGAAPDQSFPATNKPQGEALKIQQNGGQYISLLGKNNLFHHPKDRWPVAVDVDQVTRFAQAFSNLAITLAQ